ncbi:uncharacterized protein N7459_004256 [Penicillium hispanicum]|uniref:uncharacterized protein n=1 Tax=Penicillium hispanicum TaxID=1080232 RepID=UPI00253FE539|nr:uncharacterized protein N7459_004256 [Penicillium hispanicum]KAJ5584456.1 hypothetical protein N7459_004256 [Penicillium hispanicum]
MSADEGGDPKLMSATKSDSHLESAATATPGKRKRSAQEEKSSAESNSVTSREKTNLHESLRSLVDLLVKYVSELDVSSVTLLLTLGRHDSELQLLSCPFPVSAAKPRAKRAKVASDQETSNVKSRVESGRYNTLQEFLADIERASAAVIERNQSQSNGANTDGKPLNEVVSRIAVFKKHMNSLVGQSFVNQADVKAESSEDDTEEQVQSTVTNVGAREDKQALTLFGGSQSNPKQLFSSLQKSVKVPLSSSESGMEKFVEVQEELREGVLPNGISATKVVPYNLNANPPPTKRTFGEVFGPRPGVPQMEPPRRRSSRSTSASWIDPFDLAFDTKNFLGERNNYCLTPLPSGQWLQYGGVTSSPSYWSRAEKHKTDEGLGAKDGDPALWTGDDTSLFQGVYSSFAPSFDSSGSVVQVDSKDLVWWSKRGAKRLRTLLSIPYQEEEITTVQPGSIGDLDESTLEEMVQSFNPDDFSYDPLSEPPNKEEQESREVNELLEEISESLKTLNSYQKIRTNIPLFGDDISESTETPATDFGTPDSPSDAERVVYETLRSNLAAIISSLPPYVLSKLDGDQLAELNVSQKILIENPDYSGTMDKDDYTLHQERVAALAAQSNAVNRASTPSASRSGSFQGPHSSYNQRAFGANAQLSQSQGRFQVPPQGRQPLAANTFTPGYAGTRPPSTPQGPGYGQANPQYSQANTIPQFQRPTPNGYSPYAARPAQPSQPLTPRPGQPAPYNATPQGRTPYAPAVSAQRFQYANQTPSQGAFSNAAAAAAAAVSSRTVAEQAAKAQLAAQQPRQSPSTPQPQFEARHSQEGSLTPGSKQNGTPVHS